MREKTDGEKCFCGSIIKGEQNYGRSTRVPRKKRKRAVAVVKAKTNTTCSRVRSAQRGPRYYQSAEGIQIDLKMVNQMDKNSKDKYMKLDIKVHNK